ncbi:MAG TPA: hypothetical protein VD905_14005 [Flavobacteriales bacterium]|nr:hypothetical protein [Flavobacteriales bacterium]
MIVKFTPAIAGLGLVLAFTGCAGNAEEPNAKTTYEKPARHSEERVAILFGNSETAMDSLSGLEMRLQKALEESKTGIYRNYYNENPGMITMHMFGPSAQKLFDAIKPVLKQYDFMRYAKIEFRLEPLEGTKYVEFNFEEQENE